MTDWADVDEFSLWNAAGQPEDFPNGKVAAALRKARTDALEEAARYCDEHAMATGGHSDPNKFEGYIPSRWRHDGFRHPGNGYAFAIRALKDKE